MKLLLLCRHCKNRMLYESRGLVENKSKKCVFCGKNFRVQDAVLQQKP